MALLEPVSRLHATNPFEPAYEALVNEALGDRSGAGAGGGGSNTGLLERKLARLTETVGMVLAVVAHGLANGATATARELTVYRGAALHGLSDGLAGRFRGLIEAGRTDAPFYDGFLEEYRFLFGHCGVAVPAPGHLFALLYQMRRAWHFIGTKIRGGAPSAAAARAAVWRANLGSDFEAYAGGLYRYMDEIPVLVTGETGTGKELAAQCVGWSRYIPFDPATKRFATTHDGDFHVRNLADVPRELVDGALFGHKRGSFTGATGDAVGCLSLPKEHGSLFFDEIGELPEYVQVKLLRPLESREYLPIGETRPRRLLGRQVFATNRDLEARCREGRFRADLLERINGVPVRMPPLRQLLAEAPDELHGYVSAFLAEKLDDPAQVARWAGRVVDAIGANRRGDAWSRNMRELKHYAENYLLTDGRMSPAPPPPPVAPVAQGAPESTCEVSSGILGPRAKAGEVTLEEIARDYVTRVHVLTDQNRSETARRTGLNWRTVPHKLDPARLIRWLARRPKKDPEE